MKNIIIFSIFNFLLYINSVCQIHQKEFPVLKGPYLGQKIPGKQAELFAPAIVSTGLNESVIAFSPDGEECFWSVFFTGFQTILTSRLVNGEWTKPEVAPFSGQYHDGGPAFHPDGSKLFFNSARPHNNYNEITAKYNIWYIEKENGKWNKPKIVEPPINGNQNSTAPSVTKNGTIYFSKRFSDDTEKICCSKLINDKYQELEILPTRINSTQYNFHAFISPDERYLTMPAYRGKDAANSEWNYYVSFRKSDGQWSDLVNLGKEVNSVMCAGASSFSTDGKYFFFQGIVAVKETLMLDKKYSLKELIERDYRTHSNGSADIYWIDSSVIEKLKPKE
jgi:Tol biopolymer transport system component